MAEIAPLDILGKTFSKRLKGYDPGEVHEFLSQVASAMESLLRDRGELKQQIHRLERDLREFRQREKALQDVLVSAQKSAEGTLDSARAEAQRIIEEGQNLVDRLLEDAHQRAHNIESVIAELRGQRRQARAELMRIAELLQGLIQDDQANERNEPATPQLALLRRQREANEGQQ